MDVQAALPGLHKKSILGSKSMQLYCSDKKYCDISRVTTGNFGSFKIILVCSSVAWIYVKKSF
jgi:hypothetical protein